MYFRSDFPNQKIDNAAEAERAISIDNAAPNVLYIGDRTKKATRNTINWTDPIRISSLNLFKLFKRVIAFVIIEEGNIAMERTKNANSADT